MENLGVEGQIILDLILIKIDKCWAVVKVVMTFEFRTRLGHS